MSKRFVAPDRGYWFPQLSRSAKRVSLLQKIRLATANQIGRAAYMRDMDAITYVTQGLESFANAEEAEAKEMILYYRLEVPAAIQAWVKSTPGLGERSVAQLLGELGHPLHAVPHATVRDDDDEQQIVAADEFHRSVKQLWQYCNLGRGGGIPSGAGQEQVLAQGKPWLKVLMFRVSTNCKRLTGEPDKNGLSKERSPYRDVYEHEKKLAVARGWDEEKSRQLGSNRAEMHAVRMTSKSILADMRQASFGTCCDRLKVDKLPAARHHCSYESQSICGRLPG